jgi:hypothetical protein
MNALDDVANYLLTEEKDAVEATVRDQRLQLRGDVHSRWASSSYGSRTGPSERTPNLKAQAVLARTAKHFASYQQGSS